MAVVWSAGADFKIVTSSVPVSQVLLTIPNGVSVQQAPGVPQGLLLVAIALQTVSQPNGIGISHMNWFGAPNAVLTTYDSNGVQTVNQSLPAISHTGRRVATGTNTFPAGGGTINFEFTAISDSFGTDTQVAVNGTIVAVLTDGFPAAGGASTNDVLTGFSHPGTVSDAEVAFGNEADGTVSSTIDLTPTIFTTSPGHSLVRTPGFFGLFGAAAGETPYVSRDDRLTDFTGTAGWINVINRQRLDPVVHVHQRFFETVTPQQIVLATLPPNTTQIQWVAVAQSTGIGTPPLFLDAIIILADASGATLAQGATRAMVSNGWFGQASGVFVDQSLLATATQVILQGEWSDFSPPIGIQIQEIISGTLDIFVNNDSSAGFSVGIGEYTPPPPYGVVPYSIDFPVGFIGFVGNTTVGQWSLESDDQQVLHRPGRSWATFIGAD